MSSSSARLVQADGDIKKRGSVGVVVMNQGATPFTFGPENVTATLADGTPVAIITYERLAHEERRRETWAAVAAGFAAAGNSMSAANAGWYHGTATYSGSTFGTFGSTPYSANTFGTATISGYNSGAAQAAQSAANAQNGAMFARMAQQNSANRQSLKGYMRTTTVDPQQMFGGTVIFELPKAAFVPVTIDAASCSLYFIPQWHSVLLGSSRWRSHAFAKRKYASAVANRSECQLTLLRRN